MSTFAQTYLPILQSYQAELLTRLETLINIDSGSGQSEGVEQIMQHLQAWVSELGLSIVAESKGGVSDANLLVGAGVPTLDSLGPIGAGMHDLNREYLRIDSLPVRGALLAGLIHRLSLSESTG